VLAAALLVLPSAGASGARRLAVDSSDDRVADTWLARALDPGTGFQKGGRS